MTEIPEEIPEKSFTDIPAETEGLEIPTDTNYTEQSDEYFTFLGWEKNENGTLRHYFFPKSSKAILFYTGTSLQNKANLMTLAPLYVWQRLFPTKSKAVPDTLVQYLIHTSTVKGPFNSRNIRGRGAWLDYKDIVIHSGDYVIKNGQRIELGDIKSKFVYEHSPHLGFKTEKPLNAQTSKKFFDICEMLNWERKIDAYLLAGWCVVAPVCGALKWRPHIWLTGAAGTGKSWVFKKIVRRSLDHTALAVQGDTTEAGLRQALRNDALPVVFDEADTDDRRSIERQNNVLTLMRSASSDDSGSIIKGSASHTSHSYSMRSCFAFASINVSVSKQSDRSRVSILPLKNVQNDDDKNQKWEKLNQYYNEIITDEFISSLQARTLKLLPIILKNCDTFANAAASVLGGQRVGDQYGVLLAGAYSLFRSDEIKYEEALEWIKSKEWVEELNEESNRDEIQLFHFVMAHIMEVETEMSRYKRTIGELIKIADNHDLEDVNIKWHHAAEVLKRIGIKIDGDFIAISNTAPYIRNLLKETPWHKNHNKILMRLADARPLDSTKFAPGIQTRAVGVPKSFLMD